MPRISKKHARQRPQLSVTQVYALVTGHDFFGEWRAPGEDPDADSHMMREAWGDLGPALTAFHVQQYPATRPSGWWTFEAPERRPRVDGKAHPFDDGSTPAQWQTLSHGLPRVLQTEDHFEALYESQPAYLHRLRFLTAAERRAVDTVDAEASPLEDHPRLTLAQVRAWLEDQR